MMIKKISVLIGAAMFSLYSQANTVVDMKTNMGNIEIELFDQQAPVSAKNFISYVKSGFYQGTVFHRVIPGFMIQGGGMDASLNEKKTAAPIRNEAFNGLKNERGTLAMARTNNPNSATSQFFINLKNNDFLNQGATDAGYAVFGRVTRGMEVVDKIAKVPTTRRGMYQDVPRQPVQILNVQIKSTKTVK